MVLRYAYGLDTILELSFVTFLLCELCNFLTSDFMKVYRRWVPCKRNFLYNVNPFLRGLKMCMWFGFNPAVSFCHFSTLLTLSFFIFSQVRHQLHRSSMYMIMMRLIFASLTISSIKTKRGGPRSQVVIDAYL